MGKEVFKINGGVKEVTIKHANALDEKQPVVISIIGNIDSPVRWLEKRVVALPETVSDNSEGEAKSTSNEEKKELLVKAFTGMITEIHNAKYENLVEQHVSHVIINREEMGIMLVFNETDPFYRGKVMGNLTFHEDFLKWGINNGIHWNHEDLAEFIKMNRSCFNSKKDANLLSAELKNLKIKVEKEVEASNDNRGNVRVLAAQNVIDTTLPKVIDFNVPVFKGQEKQRFQAEVYVNASNFQVSLVSPDAKDIVAEVKDSIIDEQKKAIAELAPNIVIIEQ